MRYLFFFLKRALLGCCTIAIASQANAQTDLWWTGQGTTDSWNEAANWSTTNPVSGIITPAVSPPSAAIHVHFTDASFTAAEVKRIDINNAANCRDFDFSGIGNAPYVSITGTGSLSVYGSLSLLPSAQLDLRTYSGSIQLKASSAGQTIDLNQQSLNSDLIFDGIGGEWTLLNGFTVQSLKEVTLNNGTLNTNNYDFSCGRFTVNAGVGSRKVLFGTTTITITGQGNSFSITDNTTLIGTPSLLFTHHQLSYLSHGLTSPSPGFSYKKIASAAPLSLRFGADNVASIEHLVCPGFDIAATGGGFYAHSIIVEALHSSSLNNQTVTCDLFTINNGGCSRFHHLSDGTLNFTQRPSGFADAFLKHVSVVINGAAPALPIEVTNGVDGGENSGWAFASISRDLYWIGKTGNWHDPANWSLTSGGMPLGATDCPPTIYDDVFFDNASFDADAQAMHINGRDAYCRNMTWQGLDQNGIDWKGDASLYLGGDLQLDAQMKPVISFNQNLYLLDPIDGVLDFGSGPDNRKMTNTNFIWEGPGATYRLESSHMSVGKLRMNSDNSRHLNLGGRGHILEVRSIEQAGTIDMRDAIVQLYGSGINITASINLKFNANSHWHVTANDAFYFYSVQNTFPSMTIGNPAATANFAVSGNSSSFSVEGTFSTNASVTFHQHTISHKLVLAPGKSYFFTPGTTLTIGESLQADGASCGSGAKLLPTAGGGNYNIRVPGENVNVRYATISNATYIGSTSLNLGGQHVTDGGSNSNISFGSTSGRTFYWRASSQDGLTYSGNWNDPYHWALNKSDITGQKEATGCLPSALDSVVFDALSGNGNTVTVTVSDNQAVKSLVFDNEGADALPNGFVFVQNGVLEIKQLLAFSANLNTTGSGIYLFNGSGSTDIDTKARPFLGAATFLFSGGIKILQSDLNASFANLELVSGDLNTNGKTVTIATILSNSNNPRTLNLTNSQIYLTGTRKAPSITTPFSWYIGYPASLTLKTVGSTIHNTAASSFSFFGGSKTYGRVIFKPANDSYGYTYTINDGNTYSDLLYVQGTARFSTSFTVNTLSLAANCNHVFPPGGITTFLAGGNLVKNGNLNQYLILKSLVTGNPHTFHKPSGSRIYVCNIAVSDIKATGVAFQTNDASTYNGVAGSANPIFPVGSTWNFKASIGRAQITMSGPTDLHMNLGDSLHIPYEISLNNVGPYKVLFESSEGSVLEEVPSSGSSSTNGAFYMSPSATESIRIAAFQYFDCPGYYPNGTILNHQTNIHVPPISNGVVTSDAYEEYTLKNLNSFVYIMNGEDRTDVSSYLFRTAQVAIKDKTHEDDNEALGAVRVRTKIDPAEKNNGDTWFLKRHFDFEAATSNRSAMVKFYFTHEELQSLKDRDPKASPSESVFEYLQKLVVYNLPLGGDPTLSYYPAVPKISTGIAAEFNVTTYYIEAKIPEFVGSYYIGTAALPLPVTFFEFNAVTEGQRVRLTWLTGNEVGVNTYWIMRSRDRVVWEPVVSVPASHFGRERERYQAYDAHPLSGVSYYQLVIRETNGQTSYSKIVPVVRKQLGYTRVYPNPATNKVIISFPVISAFRNIWVTTVLGEKVAIPIRIAAFRAELDVAALSAGTYLIHVLDDTGSQVYKVLKK